MAVGEPGTGRKCQGRQDPHRVHAVQAVFSGEEGLPAVFVFVSLALSTTVSQNCVGGVVESRGSGLQKAVPPVRFPYISYELGIVLPSTPEAGCPGFLPGHCTL